MSSDVNEMQSYDKRDETRKRRLGWLFALPLALVVLTHGLIHLMYVTYDPDVTGLGFNGESILPASLTGSAVALIIFIVVASYTAAALGLMRSPILRDHISSLIIFGSLVSLLGFLVMLPGLVPDLAAHMFGPITSIVLALGCVYRDAIANGAAKVLPGFLSRRMGVAA